MYLLIHVLFLVTMEGSVVRTLRNAGGPRSTTELAKGCKATTEEMAQICNHLSKSGQLIKITDSMWCFNPKCRPCTGTEVNGSNYSTKRFPPRPLVSSRFQRPAIRPVLGTCQRSTFRPPFSEKSSFSPREHSLETFHHSPNIQSEPTETSFIKSEKQLTQLNVINSSDIKSDNSLSSGISEYHDTASYLHPSRRGFVTSSSSIVTNSVKPKAETKSTRPPPRPLMSTTRPSSLPVTSITASHSGQIMDFKAQDKCTSIVVHPSRTFKDEATEEKSDVSPELSGSEKFLFGKIKSSNNPWSIRQLNQSGCSASHSLCESLAKKGHIIKIEMGNEEPMYTVNPKKLSLLKKPVPSIKRQAPVPADTSVNSMPTKVPRMEALNPKISCKIAHDSINKNPISAITELGQALGWASTFNVTRESGSKNRKQFHMRLSMGPRTFDSVATSKKVAKQNVAELALRILHSENSGGSRGQISQAPIMDISQKNSRDPDVITSNINQFEPVPVSKIEGTGFFGKAGRFSYDTYNKLASTVHLSTVGRKVIAVFFVEDSRSGIPKWSPISLGSGNRTVNGENINFEGKTVNDSHAEITARRGLRRFLWRQLRIVAGKEHNSLPFESVLEKGQDGLHHIKEGVLFHLFISTAPCGDSAIFPIAEATISNVNDTTHHPVMDNDKQGLLRSKMECGQGTNPTSVTEDPLTVDGIMMGDQRLKTMSCSDKVSRWNMLGLQGCLLSKFLNPIYLSTLTLGCLYHHGHLSRAMCCRYSGISLPLPYRLNHPLLGCVPGQEAERELGKTNEMSMNWCAGDEKVEVLDGCRGRCAKGVVSRIARVNIFKEFSDYSGTDCNDYNKVKEGISGYSAAKEAYNKFVKIKKYGVWIKKPIY